MGLHQSGELIQAQAVYQQVLRLNPDHFEVLHLLGVLAYQQKHYEVAVDLIGRAISLHAKNANFYYNRANALVELGRNEEALAGFDAALKLLPEFADAFNNKGLLLLATGHIEDALPCMQEVVRIRPNSYIAHFNLGNVAAGARRFDAAIEAYNQSIALSPEFAQAFTNRGSAKSALGLLANAVEDFNTAIRLSPTLVEAYVNRGNAQEKMKNSVEAMESFSSAYAINQSFPYLAGTLFNAKNLLCDWEAYEQNRLYLLESVKQGAQVAYPFTVLALTDDPAIQQKAAATWMSNKHPLRTDLGEVPKRERKEKIRVGYYSADFHNHATAYLMAELFELHDKSRFELIAFSFGPDRRDEMRSRLEHAFDQFIDVRHMSDIEVAKYSRELNIDIAIDLKGYTQDHRSSIFAYRAAPVQVNYIGYPGTMSAEYMDFVIADRVVIPESHKHYYTEKIVFLPNSYQVNDRQRKISDRVFTRQEFGLPEEAFVFCCFNSSYKITPDVFSVWMVLLNQIPSSVLWLLKDSDMVCENLRQDAIRFGIDPNRLIFASRERLDDHLKRQQLADLFLDSWPVNAHTTASDALWAGLPVLTCLGNSFASRVAASLLSAVGLPDLIKENESDYVSHAIYLAQNPESLKNIRNQLAKNLAEAPLFDTRLYVKHLETSFEKMMGLYHADQPFSDIHIEPTEVI